MLASETHRSAPGRRPSRAVTLEIRDTCLCMHAHRASRALARAFDAAFRPLGLTHGQFSLLMSLNRPSPPTISSIADVLGMDRTSLTAKLKPLERRGLLRVHPDARDRRSRRVVLTEAGGALLVRAVPVWRTTHRRLDRVLPRRAQAEVLDGLRAVVTSLERDAHTSAGVEDAL